MRGKMKRKMSEKKMMGLFLIISLIVFAAFPLRRLVVSGAAGRQQVVFPVPESPPIFRIVYDSRDKGLSATGEFSVCPNGEIQPLGRICNKPEKGLKRFFSAKDCPVPALHLVVSKEKSQMLLLNERKIRFDELFSEGAVLTIKTIRRPRVYWWWMRYEGE
jgi:hypothetical protein